jgi:hypothetical protein
MISLAIGYILLAISEIIPRFIKDEEKSSSISILLASISFLIFLNFLIFNFLK